MHAYLLGAGCISWDQCFNKIIFEIVSEMRCTLTFFSCVQISASAVTEIVLNYVSEKLFPKIFWPFHRLLITTLRKLGWLLICPSDLHAFTCKSLSTEHTSWIIAGFFCFNMCCIESVQVLQEMFRFSSLFFVVLLLMFLNFWGLNGSTILIKINLGSLLTSRGDCIDTCVWIDLHIQQSQWLTREAFGHPIR